MSIDGVNLTSTSFGTFNSYIYIYICAFKAKQCKQYLTSRIPVDEQNIPFLLTFKIFNISTFGVIYNGVTISVCLTVHFCSKSYFDFV